MRIAARSFPESDGRTYVFGALPVFKRDRDIDVRFHNFSDSCVDV